MGEGREHLSIAANLAESQRKFVVTLPHDLKDRILRTVAGERNPGNPIDDEAAWHGAIALWGSIGGIIGLRPDGTLWRFDADSDLPLAPLAPEQALAALVNGTRRFAWLVAALPSRPFTAKDCELCEAHCFLGPSEQPGHYRAQALARENWDSMVCPNCQGLGWLPI